MSHLCVNCFIDKNKGSGEDDEDIEIPFERNPYFDALNVWVTVLLLLCTSINCAWHF